MKKHTEMLKMVAQDMKNDAKEFDGKPFNGATVAEYFGNHGAAIAALAETLIVIETNWEHDRNLIMQRLKELEETDEPT